MTPDTKNTSDQPVLERGVYTLANDVVIEWFQAFIRSFRKTNPTLPLTVIPYDRNISRLQMLRGKFHFEIMDDSSCCHYDALADKVKVIKKEAGCFRKFACFFGNYREFLFLDADIVTLVPLDRFFDAYSASSSQFVYFDTAMDMCYKENLAALMVSQYGSPAYNSGAFFSRRRVVAEAEIFAAAEKATAICDGFAIGGEQPFLNYVTDISRLRYADISSLTPDLAVVIWARQPFTYDRKTDVAKNAKGEIMPFIHWAGCAYPTMVRPEIFLRYRTRGLSLPDRIKYYLAFYFFRYRAYLLKAKSHWSKVVHQFFVSKAWRRFYLCKMVGIKVKSPTSYHPLETKLMASTIRRIFRKLLTPILWNTTSAEFQCAKLAFSQFGEDMILPYLFEHTYMGKYVDIGAFHPLLLSNTYALYRKGWRGIAIDPNPDCGALFARFRPGDTFVHSAVGSQNGLVEMAMFNESTFNCTSDLVDTVPDNVRLGARLYKVSIRPLSEILSSNHVDTIDLLSVDCEGNDLKILRSNDWSRWIPTVIFVEDHAEDWYRSEIALYLTSLGYNIEYRIGFSSIFVRPTIATTLRAGSPPERGAVA